MDRDTFYSVQSTPNKTPMSTSEWYMDFPDPSDYVIPLVSKSNAVEGGINAAFWWDPEIEQMILDARSKTGEEHVSPITRRCRTSSWTTPRTRRCSSRR